ncbi:MAG: amino acid ABC transporter permease [Verrucomicrobia bacterium]|nr:MAG: amino acid ABC transporter permease [Verrucomicrobiota bacterium]TAE85875.1 MAG: amino acid ABC transporter permease [Verrucomicrobiota bacterium]TAF27374.1 MAG: amino acid ABC transporter permease [Verrucomicrobiota bacterium]TAF42335.1 MAG: amino acid ABC transporter permease [Verrucomicrobiota bacterium]
MTRRQHIANTLAAILVIAGTAWLCGMIFGELGKQSNWAKAWDYRESLWRGWLHTLGIAFAALVGSMVFGLLFLFGQRSPLPVVRCCCRAFLEFVRDTPLLVHLLFGYFVIFAPLLSRPLAEAGFEDKIVIGIVLLALFEGAYLGEILRGGVESIPRTQWDSARAVGFTPFQIYRYVIFPQALRRVLPAIAGLFVSLIKDSSLLNVIGVSEYFYNTKNFISRSYAGLEGYIPLALGYLVLTLPVAWLSHWLEKRFRHET